MKETFDTFPWEVLIRWYKKNGRHNLEWRDYTIESDLLIYRVWLSEIFLQQTQVERVRDYFRKIIEKYPTIHHLARSSYEEFFPCYQGLGYYSRARNLLKTAKIISEVYSGVFPWGKKVLEKLPGVGPYTASAILAFGYGEPYLAWDTNLEKVFARYYHGSRHYKLSKEEKEEIEYSLRRYISRLSAVNLQLLTVRHANNALMDFAATVDLKNPQGINWEKYPIQSGLFYETRGALEPIELKKSVTFPTPDATIVVILHKDHKVYYSSCDSEGKRIQDLEILDHGISPHDNKMEYFPFILPPALSRDTRKYVQEYFREHYSLELSVRPAHKKWITEDGTPYIALNAQIQLGDISGFLSFSRK